MKKDSIKDASPDDIFYQTWLIECIEYNDNGEPYTPVFHDTITQDYYIPKADYVLTQKANDEKFISQIERLWALEHSNDYPDYSILSQYLKALAIKYVHKQCVRKGTQNIHIYFEDWINHTLPLISWNNDKLSIIVQNYDIDELVNLFRRNEVKLYTKILYKPTLEAASQIINLRLKDFFSIEQTKLQSKPTKDNPTKPVQQVSQYNIDNISEKINKLYDFAIETRVINSQFSKSQFMAAIETANFTHIYNNPETLKTKLKLILKQINIYLGDKYWYRDVAKSIGATPSECSGANPNDDKWLHSLNKI